MVSFEQSLDNGLVLRNVRDERDIARYARFHADITGEDQGVTCECLLRHHAAIDPNDFWFIEDPSSGEIVSSSCLIPWECRFEGVGLRIAMLEMVATHPDYRRKGLVRAQMDHFHQVVSVRGFDLSVIEGIPYYYRRFGYTYAVDHRAYDQLDPWRIPPRMDAQPGGYRLRPAVAADLPALERFYREAMAGVPLHALRSASHWEYLLQCAHLPVRVVEELTGGDPVGYVVTAQLSGGQGLRVEESAIGSEDVGIAVLRLLKPETAGGSLQISWPQSGTLMRLAHGLGSTPLAPYQWLWRITDLPRLLMRLAPVFERRLAAAGGADVSGDMTLNLFEEAFLLRLQAGRLVGVEPLGFVDASMGAEGGDLCIPRDAFVRLVLGYRSLDQLSDAWPDILVQAPLRPLIDVLFPRITSYLHMPYTARPAQDATARH
ncbi:MAG: GNAT family N-acetyltransferase [Anaerolineae bacterium]